MDFNVQQGSFFEKTHLGFGLFMYDNKLFYVLLNAIETIVVMVTSLDVILVVYLDVDK